VVVRRRLEHIVAWQPRRSNRFEFEFASENVSNSQAVSD
jgi:hypothetical protein